jgi:DNA-3-methyladenine glycosylase II
VAAVAALRRHYEDGYLEERILDRLDLKDLIDHLTAIYGIGAWTAEMVAIFYFRHKNVWSERDSSLNRAINHFSQQSKIEKQRTLDLAQPNLSYLAMHFWRAIDTGKIES